MYTLEDLLEYIKTTLDSKCNIFLHGIETESHGEKEKLQSIIQNGLECNYFTIFRTIRELGKLETITADKFNYAFMSRNGDKAINVVLAIPDILIREKEIIPLYPQDYGNSKNDDGEVRTFLDVILSEGMSIRIPKEFIYGFYELDLKTGEVRFFENGTYYLKLSEEEQEKFFNDIKGKIRKQGYEYLIDLYSNPTKENIDRGYEISELSSFRDDGVAKKVIDKINENMKLNLKKGL